MNLGIKTMVLFRVTLIEFGMIGITLAGIVVACQTTVERTHVALDEHELLKLSASQTANCPPLNKEWVALFRSLHPIKTRFSK
jgi:hypothetical protein